MLYFLLFLKGILFSTPDSLKSPMDLIRLWNHECNRVYKDKLVDNQDLEQYDKIQLDFNRKFFEVIFQFFYIFESFSDSFTIKLGCMIHDRFLARGYPSFVIADRSLNEDQTTQFHCCKTLNVIVPWGS